jgi:hypothetical protein
MGADVKFEHQRVEAGEQVADIVVTSTGKLKGVNVPRFARSFA